MNHRSIRTLRMVAIIATVGTCLQLGSCIGTGLSYAANFNPCGTILNCDPVTYRFVRSGYEGPGVDPDVDPACTYPPFCDGDPFAPAAAGAGG